MVSRLTIARQSLGQHSTDLSAGAFVAQVLNQSGFKPEGAVLYSSDVTELVTQMSRLEQVEFMQPGDILFWGVADAPYYVGLYLGGQQVIGVNHTGSEVTIQFIHPRWMPTIVGKL
ncbi:MAG TPA: NlpC/P60 family protein [Lactobacillaceae bacterium]|jgi:cell wall-associated NlpC family hydrolase